MTLTPIRTLIFAAFVISVALSSCNSAPQPAEDNTTQESAQEDQAIIQSKKVFYTMPSPMESAQILKNSDIPFQADILFDITKFQYPGNSVQKSLCLGAMFAELSYISMFGQTQEALPYMNSAQRLADDLGVINAFSEDNINRIEKNMNNKDSLVHIISGIYQNTDQYLQENERNLLAACVITGAWVEGLSLATIIHKQFPDNSKIRTRIAEQKMSIKNLLSLLEQLENHKDLAPIKSKLMALKAMYDGVQIKYNKPKADVKEQNDVIVIDNSSSANIDDTTIELINNACIELRRLIITTI